MKLLPEQNSFETNDLNEKKLPPIFTVKKKDTGIFLFQIKIII